MCCRACASLTEVRSQQEQRAFTLPTLGEPSEYLAACVVPLQELISRSFDVPSVELLEQRGASERADAQVEREVHQRIELILGEVGQAIRIGAACIVQSYQPVDRSGELGDVLKEKRQGLLLGDGEALADLRTCVAIADGPDTYRILIGSQPATFELLGELQAGLRIAKAQSNTLLTAARSLAAASASERATAAFAL